MKMMRKKQSSRSLQKAMLATFLTFALAFGGLLLAPDAMHFANAANAEETTGLTALSPSQDSDEASPSTETTSPETPEQMNTEENLAALNSEHSEGFESMPEGRAGDFSPHTIINVVVGEYLYALDDTDFTATLIGYSGTASSLYMGTSFGRTVDYGGKTYTITKIDILLTNTRVKTLSAIYNTNLTSIKVAGFPSLTGLTCNNNANLTSVDVAGNPNLETLLCDNAQLEKLDVTHNTKLSYLQTGTNKLLDVKGGLSRLVTWNGAAQSPEVFLSYDAGLNLYVSETGLIEAGHQFTYAGSETVSYNTSNNRFEVAPSSVSSNAFSGAFSTVADSGRVVSGTVTFSLESITDVEDIFASPFDFDSVGGTTNIIIHGSNFPSTLVVGLFAEGADQPTVQNTSFGNSSRQATSLDVPANQTFADQWWNVKVSADNGATWVDRDCYVVVHSSIHINEVTASPNMLPHIGGTSVVRINGADLPENMIIGFAKNAQTNPEIGAFATTTEEGTQAIADITFPPSFSDDPTIYYFWISLDNGSTWHRLDEAVTVTVAGRSTPEVPDGDIGFNGKRWLTIGQNGDGVASSEGTTTLLLAQGSHYPVSSLGSSTFNTVQFNPLANMTPVYNGSYLEQEMQTIANTISSNAHEYQAITPRLLSGSNTYGDLDNHYGTDVNALVWPLSAREAISLTGDVAASNYRAFSVGDSNGTELDFEHDKAPIYQGLSWLRSSNSSTMVWDTVSDGSLSGYYLFVSKAVRPTLQLDLNDILFKTAATNNEGKNSAALGNVVELPSIQGPGTVKYTLIDQEGTFDSFSSTASRLSASKGETIRIPFSGAVTGNQTYVSATITRRGSNTPLYYVKLSENMTSGQASLTLPNSIGKGSYTINLFNERIEPDNFSDLAGAPINIDLEVGEKNASRLTVNLSLDKPYNQATSFMVRIENRETAQECTKIITIDANETLGSFDIYVEPGIYGVEILDEGSTWRYIAEAGHEVTVGEGTDETAELNSFQKTTRWVSGVANLINIMRG